jgi:hypothetical protein
MERKSFSVTELKLGRVERWDDRVGMAVGGDVWCSLDDWRVRRGYESDGDSTWRALDRVVEGVPRRDGGDLGSCFTPSRCSMFFPLGPDKSRRF